MKTINLRDYYPSYMTDAFVDVPDEVAALLRRFKLDETAYRLRTLRHKAYFSLDYGDDIEREALSVTLSIYELLEQQMEYERLRAAMTLLPDKQRSRVYAHYVLGMSKAAIARLDGASEGSVRDSIKRGLRRLKKMLNDF